MTTPSSINSPSDILRQIQGMLNYYEGKISPEETTEMADKLCDWITLYLSEKDSHIHQELHRMGTKLYMLRKELTDSYNGQGDLGEAQMELAQVLTATEQATDIILDAVESLQNSIADDDQEKQTALTSILEACNFQDITGQRLKKVESTLALADVAVGELLRVITAELGKLKPPTEEEQLMSGPQSGGAPTQEDIDRLFDD